MLNGMSEQEFYDMYPTQEDWDNAQQMKLGGLSGAPHNGQPTADQFFSYGSHYNDSVNVPMGNPYYAAEGGTPYYGGPSRPYQVGGPAYEAEYKESRAGDSSRYDPQYDIMDLYKSGTFHDYDGIDFAKRFGYVGSDFDAFEKKQKDLYEDPMRLGMIDGQRAAHNAYKKGQHKPLALTNDQVIYLAKLYEKNGNSSSEGFKNNLSPQDYKRVESMKNWYTEKNKAYGGSMEQGGDYNSPTNYGSFNVPMAYGGMPMAQPGIEVNPNYEYYPLSKNDSMHVANLLKKPDFDPAKYNYEVKRPKSKILDKIIADHVYRTDAKGNKTEYMGWDKSPAKHAAIQEFIARRDLAAGKVPSEQPIFADTYNKYLSSIKKEEDGGILDASNNQSYPMFEDGGKSNLLNLIKAASKKMKKAYGGDTVTQGGNSDNYPQNITQAFKNGIKNNTMMALMNEEEKAFTNQIKQNGAYNFGGYTDNYNMGYDQGNMYNGYGQGQPYQQQNQGPQLDPQNQAMQKMHEQRADDLQNNLNQSGQNFMNATSNLAYSSRPQTKLKVAGVGMETQSTEPSRNMSPEEWAWMDQQRKANENQANYNKYFKSNTQGMNYAPMNYRYKTKISKDADAKLKALAANPSSNLKKYVDKDTLFGHKTKLVFGSKDLYEDNMKIKSAPDAPNHHNNNKLSDFLNKIEDRIKPKPNTSVQQGKLSGNSFLRAGVGNGDKELDNAYTPERQTLNLPNSPMMQGPTQGAETREESTKGQAPFYAPTHSPIPRLPAYAPGRAYGGSLMKAQDGTSLDDNMPIKMQPIDTTAGFSDYVNNQGLNLQQQQGHLKDPETGSMYTGKEKKTKVVQKTGLRPNGEPAANWINSGINLLASGVNMGNMNTPTLTGTDAYLGNSKKDLGMYDVNTGNANPNNMTPVQFTGNAAGSRGTIGAYGGSFQDGGMQQQPDPQQVMQGVATMLQQGAQPEQIAKQLVEMGIPQEQVVQLIQAVMQQLQGGQEEPQAMRYGGFAEGGASNEDSYEDDLSDDEIADLRAQGYDVEYI